jgi:spoIIIJ-associated protein
MTPNEFITTTLTTLFGHMGVKLDAIVLEEDTKMKSTRFAISTPDAFLLTGEGGARLLALDHMMKRIVEHRFGEDSPSFFVDIQDFQKKKMEDVRAKAHMLAERARYFKSAVEMDPMSSYERLIVHAEFSDSHDITTTSSGTGLGRHIVLSYKEPLQENTAL